MERGERVMTKNTGIVLTVLLVLFGVLIGLTKAEDRKYDYKV